jgi:hypothetical protein
MTRTAALAALPAAMVLMAADKPPPDALKPAFGSTIVSTYPDGRQARLWLQPDGGYTAEGRRHDPSSGHWKVKDDKVCLKQSHPFPAPFAYCTPLPVGESWTAKAVTGERIQVRLVKGKG